MFFPGKSHVQSSLVGYSPQAHKESDTTEYAHTAIWQLHFFWFILYRFNLKSKQKKRHVTFKWHWLLSQNKGSQNIIKWHFKVPKKPIKTINLKFYIQQECHLKKWKQNKNIRQTKTENIFACSSRCVEKHYRKISRLKGKDITCKLGHARRNNKHQNG